MEYGEKLFLAYMGSWIVDRIHASVHKEALSSYLDLCEQAAALIEEFDEETQKGADVVRDAFNKAIKDRV